MTSEKSAWAFLASCWISLSCCIATVSAGPVSLPFFEPFNTISADATVDYPQFTRQHLEGFQDQWTVDAKGLRTNSVNFFNLAEPAFSVTPSPKPTGEIVINVDMGWAGADATPPSCTGCGATGLRFGEDPTKPNYSQSTMVFHPGYNAPPGAFRVNGPDPFGNESMGWVPQLGVLNHVEIHSFPDGLFTIKITDGSNPANVFEEVFMDPVAYGGDIGFLAAGGGAAIYKNLSIVLANPPAGVQGDYNGNGVVDAADYVLWRNGGPLQNEVDNLGVVDGGDYTAWRARFGNTSGSGSGFRSGSAVPEPATLTMLISAGIALLFKRRKLAE